MAGPGPQKCSRRRAQLALKKCIVMNAHVGNERLVILFEKRSRFRESTVLIRVNNRPGAPTENQRGRETPSNDTPGCTDGFAARRPIKIHGLVVSALP